MNDIHVSTYINFQGRAREALEFYQRILGGTLDSRTLVLDIGGTSIVGTDGSPQYPPQVGDNVAVALGGTDKYRMAAAFVALADGGRVKMPLAEQPGGGEVGWLTDKFGITWQVSVETVA